MRRVTLSLAVLLSIFASVSIVRAQNARTVLIEEFTSATCDPCVQATPIINRIINNNSGRVISVRYHMSFPHPGDPWYTANPTENDARKTSYGVVGIPAAEVDGHPATPTTESDMVTAVNDELAKSASANLEVTQSRQGEQATVTVKVTATEDLTGDTLRVAAVESHIHVDDLSSLGGWNKEKDFYDVFRKMISGMDGTSINLTAGQSKTFTFNYTVDTNWQADQMYAVAFLQDVEVVQAGYSPRPTSSVETPESFAGFSLESSAPNPASMRASIGYSLGSAEHITIELHDLSGALVTTLDEGTREAGSYHTLLDVSGLPSGVYSYTIHAGRYRESRQLTVMR